MSAPESTGHDDAIAKAGGDMGLLFDGFFGSIESLRQSEPSSTQRDVHETIANISSHLWTPRVERHEDDTVIRLTASLPNVASNQIHVSTDTPGRIKIFGECNSQVVYEHGADRVTERQLGQFEKDIPLPSSARVELMTTVLQGSDMIITIPKQ
ncbi:hypothetical protein GGI04_002254 [Coemansia thaxteri]|uniref:SHSP domain-containing protein n=1 Tax=Coemansia thaxteri TaxID=2663907 RepID=A0A9W8BJG7_9FUNG|nr:hypothetical protein GGI04_002254 [Coemansia thaxteri]KAJ2008706.1 hypothetical protein H4R26_000025 [Coemansia thaxteri]KAJ2473892.1 hypothetical protein GGI02_000511 [Coemansia sp. RSA 2322]KAJ2488067.1 hypothetical protein EV174_000173 [Coemansia sp. RSA 2320]